VRLEGLVQLKNSMASSGIEPATFQLVAECLNKLRYRVPPFSQYRSIISLNGIDRLISVMDIQRISYEVKKLIFEYDIQIYFPFRNFRATRHFLSSGLQTKSH
jgi:hypothetical protein